MAEKDVKIVWVINAYRNPEQLIHTINRILGSGDIAFVHYDKKSSKQEVSQLKQFYKNNSKVRIYQEYKVFWGGFHIVLADWFLGKKLLKSQAEFDYVIHFTGTTYPIKKDHDFRNFLRDNYGKSFIDLDPNEEISEQGSQRSSYFAKEHFGVYPGRNIPKYNFPGRLLYKINLKCLRLLSKLGFIKTKTFLPSAFPQVYRGFVHNIIHRDHYTAIFSDPRSKKFLWQLRYVSCPDEVFFNTALVNIASPERLVRDDNLLTTYWRKGPASPDNITEEDISDLLHGDSFFARKFESLELLKMIDEQMHNGKSFS